MKRKILSITLVCMMILSLMAPVFATDKVNTDTFSAQSGEPRVIVECNPNSVTNDGTYKNDEFEIEVFVQNIQDLYGAGVSVKYDPNIFEVVEDSPGAPFDLSECILTGFGEEASTSTGVGDYYIIANGNNINDPNIKDFAITGIGEQMQLDVGDSWGKIVEISLRVRDDYTGPDHSIDFALVNSIQDLYSELITNAVSVELANSNDPNIESNVITYQSYEEDEGTIEIYFENEINGEISLDWTYQGDLDLDGQLMVPGEGEEIGVNVGWEDSGASSEYPWAVFLQDDSTFDMGGDIYYYTAQEEILYNQLIPGSKYVVYNCEGTDLSQYINDNNTSISVQLDGIQTFSIDSSTTGTGSIWHVFDVTDDDNNGIVEIVSINEISNENPFGYEEPDNWVFVETDPENIKANNSFSIKIRGEELGTNADVVYGLLYKELEDESGFNPYPTESNQITLNKTIEDYETFYVKTFDVGVDIGYYEIDIYENSSCGDESYLGFGGFDSYDSLVNAPQLTLNTPSYGDVVTNSSIELSGSVIGSVDDLTYEINWNGENNISLDEFDNFSTNIMLQPGLNEIFVRSENAGGYDCEYVEVILSSGTITKPAIIGLNNQDSISNEVILEQSELDLIGGVQFDVSIPSNLIAVDENDNGHWINLYIVGNGDMLYTYSISIIQSEIDEGKVNCFIPLSEIGFEENIQYLAFAQIVELNNYDVVDGSDYSEMVDFTYSSSSNADYPEICSWKEYDDYGNLLSIDGYVFNSDPSYTEVELYINNETDEPDYVTYIDEQEYFTFSNFQLQEGLNIFEVVYKTVDGSTSETFYEINTDYLCTIPTYDDISSKYNGDLELVVFDDDTWLNADFNYTTQIYGEIFRVNPDSYELESKGTLTFDLNNEKYSYSAVTSGIDFVKGNDYIVEFYDDMQNQIGIAHFGISPQIVVTSDWWWSSAQSQNVTLSGYLAFADEELTNYNNLNVYINGDTGAEISLDANGNFTEDITLNQGYNKVELEFTWGDDYWTSADCDVFVEEQQFQENYVHINTDNPKETQAFTLDIPADQLFEDIINCPNTIYGKLFIEIEDENGDTIRFDPYPSESNHFTYEFSKYTDGDKVFYRFTNPVDTQDPDLVFGFYYLTLYNDSSCTEDYFLGEGDFDVYNPNIEAPTLTLVDMPSIGDIYTDTENPITISGNVTGSGIDTWYELYPSGEEYDIILDPNGDFTEEVTLNQGFNGISIRSGNDGGEVEEFTMVFLISETISTPIMVPTAIWEDGVLTQEELQGLDGISITVDLNGLTESTSSDYVMNLFVTATDENDNEELVYIHNVPIDFNQVSFGTIDNYIPLSEFYLEENVTYSAFTQIVEIIPNDEDGFREENIVDASYYSEPVTFTYGQANVQQIGKPVIVSLDNQTDGVWTDGITQEELEAVTGENQSIYLDVNLPDGITDGYFGVDNSFEGYWLYLQIEDTNENIACSTIAPIWEDEVTNGMKSKSIPTSDLLENLVDGTYNIYAQILQYEADVIIDDSNYSEPFEFTYSTTIQQPSSDATLIDLSVDGKTIEGFSVETVNYEVTFPVEPPLLPNVTALASDANATVEITQVTSLPGTATVVVTAEDGVTKKTYTVEFDVAAENKVGNISFKLYKAIDNTYGYEGMFEKTGSELDVDSIINPDEYLWVDIYATGIYGFKAADLNIAFDSNRLEVITTQNSPLWLSQGTDYFTFDVPAISQLDSQNSEIVLALANSVPINDDNKSLGYLILKAKDLEGIANLDFSTADLVFLEGQEQILYESNTTSSRINIVNYIEVDITAILEGLKDLSDMKIEVYSENETNYVEENAIETVNVDSINNKVQFSELDINTTYRFIARAPKRLSITIISSLSNVIDNGLDFGTLLVGDINGDDRVDIMDFSRFATAYVNKTNDGDFNNDNTTDIIDFSRFASNYGKNGSTVEE